MDSLFRFKRFSLHNEKSALKLGTDAVLLGAAMTLKPEDRLALDIGTGTGIIALMATQRAPQLRVEAIDIDGPSAGEAALNFSESPWPDRLHAVHRPLSEYAAPGRFDLIFSNPPYYDNSLRNPDERVSAARHSDSLTLAQIFSYASEWLGEGGRLSLILPADVRISSLRAAASFGFRPFRTIFVKTTPAKEPKRIISEFSREQLVESQETIILMTDGARSQQYSLLTREFYLDSSQIGQFCHK